MPSVCNQEGEAVEVMGLRFPNRVGLAAGLERAGLRIHENAPVLRIESAAQGWLLHNGLNPYETPVSVLPGAFADQVAWVWRYTPAPYGPLSLQISHLMVVLGGLNPYYSTLLMRIPALIGVVLIVVPVATRRDAAV